MITSSSCSIFNIYGYPWLSKVIVTSTMNYPAIPEDLVNNHRNNAAAHAVEIHYSTIVQQMMEFLEEPYRLPPSGRKTASTCLMKSLLRSSTDSHNLSSVKFWK